MPDEESPESDTPTENSKQPEQNGAGPPITFHGKFVFSDFLICLIITVVYLVLIAAGLSSVLETWLESSGDELGAVCGVWGSLIVMILGAAFFLFIEDSECEVSFHGNRMEYTGWHYMRPEKKVTFSYGEIDTLEFQRNEEGALVGRYHELLIEDSTRERSITKKNSICLYPGGFTKKDFINICEELNTRLLEGRIDKVKMHSLRDEFKVFGKPGEELREILEKEYGSKRLKARK